MAKKEKIKDEVGLYKYPMESLNLLLLRKKCHLN
jgi:hypothetical protein